MVPSINPAIIGTGPGPARGRDVYSSAGLSISPNPPPENEAPPPAAPALAGQQRVSEVPNNNQVRPTPVAQRAP
eukprot:scaffold32971_cov56-Isochrysis_galbana.AAC.1